MANKRNPVSTHGLSKGGSMKYADDEEYNEGGKMEKGGGYRKGEDGKLYKTGMAKSDLTPDDLQKSLDRLSAFATEDDGVTRKEELLAKAQQTDLDDEERDELFKALGGSAPAQPEPAGITSGFVENETLREALDVSDFLAETQSELVKSLEILGTQAGERDQRQHQYNLLTARVLTNIGGLVKSMHEAVVSLGGEVVQAPRSKGANAPATLEKSFGGEPPAGDQLSRSDMAEGLQSLYRDRMEKSSTSKLDNGIDLLVEVSKFESSGMMHPLVEDLVKSHINTQRQAH